MGLSTCWNRILSASSAFCFKPSNTALPLAPDIHRQRSAVRRVKLEVDEL